MGASPDKKSCKLEYVAGTYSSFIIVFCQEFLSTTLGVCCLEFASGSGVSGQLKLLGWHHSALVFARAFLLLMWYLLQRSVGIADTRQSCLETLENLECGEAAALERVLER